MTTAAAKTAKTAHFAKSIRRIARQRGLDVTVVRSCSDIGLYGAHAEGIARSLESHGYRRASISGAGAHRMDEIWMAVG